MKNQVLSMYGWSRFFFLGAFISLLSYASLVHAQGTDPIRIEQGQLTGAMTPDGAVAIYKGIPFAASPVGDLRWQAPQPARAWNGVLEADAYSDGCIQPVAGSRPPWTEEFMHQGGISEDCLYLNVWTAADAPGEKRPVLVYVHGGGYTEGSSAVAVYDGEQLARKGLVVVTINYRLGVLGFMTHPELTEESPHGASGNYGLLDQVAALQWVQDNIAAFGGNPANVTVAGQSAGAMSVYLLTASPLANGLFHRAIIQSGPGALASFGVVSASALARPLSEAEPSGVQFATAKGAQSLADLRALSAETLMAQSGGPPVRFSPVVDGWFLPQPIDAMYAQKKHNDVPVLMGMNADEPSAFPGYGKTTADDFRRQARERYQDRAEAFLQLYPAGSDEEAGRSQVAGTRDLGLVSMAQVAVERAANSDAPAYLYYFDRGIPWPQHPEFGAFHTGEVPYVFNTLSALDRPWEPVDRKLADQMSSYWANFAATGNPNGSGLPEWPAFRDNTDVVMGLGEHTGVLALPDESKRAFYGGTGVGTR